MNLEPGLQLSDLKGMVSRRAPLAVAVAVGVVLFVYWLAMALPNQYTASSVLLVEPQAVNERLVEAGVEESDLNRRLNLMTAEILSRPRLSRIIDDLGLYREESRDITREQVIDLMREDLRVEPVMPELEAGRRPGDMKIDTFRIVFSGDSPQQAADVAQTLANDFIEEHIEKRVSRTQKSREFIQAERERLTGEIQRVEQQIAEVKEENAGRLPEDVQSNQRRLERTVTDLRAAQRERDSAESDAAFWANQALAAAAESAPNDAASPQRRLQLLELSLAELKARGLTEAHPDLVQTRQELEEVRQQVESTEKGEDGEPVSFAQRSARAEQRRAELRVEAAAAEIRRLQGQREEIETSLAATPRVAERLEGLQRRWETLRRSEADLAQRAQEADVQASMERRQLGEQFRVLEAAYPPTEPSSPNRVLLLLLGAFLGMGLGGGVAVLSEMADSSLHGSRQLQSSLGIPVLAAIPSIVLESDRAARWRRQASLAVAAAAVVVFCLVGGAATYVYVNGGPGWLAGSSGSEAAQGGPASIPEPQG